MKDKKIGKERMSLAKKVGCSRLLPKDSFLDVFFFCVCEQIVASKEDLKKQYPG